MEESNTNKWNIREIIGAITDRFGTIRELYLFGSRAYNTGSMRSDLDLLAICNVPIAARSINMWLHKDYPCVDLFLSLDGINASSIVNGSVITYRGDPKYASLTEQLDAICLWKKDIGFSDSFDMWDFETDSNVDFKMSVVPCVAEESVSEKISSAFTIIERESQLIPYFTGCTWLETGESISKLIKITFDKPTRFQQRAHNFSFDTLKIKNEYDFQNLIHIILRPMFTDVTPENPTITILGQEKRADFGLCRNRIVIEAKWVDSTTKLAEVVKTLDGLTSFYEENANIRCLIFFVLYKEGVEIDIPGIERRFTKREAGHPIITTIIKNTYDS